MNEIKVTGRQNFMGLDIPVVLGGFGEGKKCVSDKTIAEIHGMEVRNVRARITDNIKRFTKGTDYIDVKECMHEAQMSENKGAYLTSTLEFLVDLGYTKSAITQAEHIYILSERGYAKLIKIMDTDLAWEVHDKLIDEYFELRDEKINMYDLDPDTQLMNLLVRNISKQEIEQKRQKEEQKRQAEKLEQLDDRIDAIKEVVSLRPNVWRKDTANIINKIAVKAGGYEHIKLIRDESYRILEERMHVALNIRLTNKRKTLALNNTCKSKLDRLNILDVIADDPKLIEGYIYQLSRTWQLNMEWPKEEISTW